MSDTERIEDYMQLRVYRMAFEMAMHLFEASKTWLKEEHYALTGQVRRSSRSVCSNSAEAEFKRRYAGRFVSKLSEASMEAGEPLAWIDFAVACGYMPDDEKTALLRPTKMTSRPDQWCIPSQVQEEDADYEAAPDRSFH